MIQSRKLKIAGAALAAVSILGIVGCGSSGKAGSKTAAAKEDNTEMHIAYTPGLCDAPIMIGLEKGFFKAEGINAKVSKVDGAHISEALGSGKVDGVQTLVSKVVQPLENGLPIKLTAGLHKGCVRILAKKESGINGVPDLKGKKIGVAGLADTAAVITQRALLSNHIGVTPSNMEVELVVIDKNALPQALESGQVDAIALTDPVGAIAQKQYNLTSVLDSTTSVGFKDEYCCDAVVTAKFAKEHPELAKKYTVAIMKSALWISQHPEEAAQIIHDKNYIPGDVALNAELLRSYNYKPSVQGGYDALKQASDQLYTLGLVKSGDGKAFADKHYLFFDGLADTPTL